MRLARLHLENGGAGGLAGQLRAAVGEDPNLDAEAAGIVAAVRDEGDAELIRLSSRFEATSVPPGEIRIAVDPGEPRRALAGLDPELAAALRLAAFNIAEVAEAEKSARETVSVTLPQGQTVQVVERPVDSAGIYVPGGGGDYPSSLLMGAVTAHAAGVSRVYVVTPAGPDGRVPEAVLAAAEIAGVDAVFATGGAQAIAALAFGTETVPAVDVIAGPGSPWVNAAKRIVFGHVGIDGVAGPSELVAVADDSADPETVALDMLAQAEHGEGGLVVCISVDEVVIEAIAQALENRLDDPVLAANPTTLSLVVAKSLEDALELADAIAAEHLELCIENAGEHADRVAGAVFVGPQAATAFGDYAAGSNHVLPTGGAARFGGPLGVRTFMRRMSVVGIGPEAADALAGPVAALADAEGFRMHAESVRARQSG